MNPNFEGDFMAEYLAVKKKTDDILALPRVTKKDAENLTGAELDYLYKTISKKLESLVDEEERAQFNWKIRPLMFGNLNLQSWEDNHALITGAIRKLILETGFMPTNTAIASETGLSRPTIIKHLKEYNSHGFAAGMEPFKARVPELLAKLHESALKGDVKAARLYFEVTGALPGGGTALTTGRANARI